MMSSGKIHKIMVLSARKIPFVYGSFRKEKTIKTRFLPEGKKVPPKGGNLKVSA